MILALLNLCLLGTAIGVAQVPSPKTEILGLWRGTSLCTNVPGNEACHDESVVYDVQDGHPGIATITLHASKIVRGETVPMYDLDFAYDSTGHRWTAEFSNARVHILWSFIVRGSEMVGTCVDLPSQLVRRNVLVHRE